MLTIIMVELAIILLILLLTDWQRRYFLVEYLLFLRYPILSALMLLLLPAVAVRFLSHFIANLFIVDNWYGLALVTCLAFLCGWVIMFTGGLIIVGAPKRFGVTFRRNDGFIVPDKPNIIMRAVQPFSDWVFSLAKALVVWLWQHPKVAQSPQFATAWAPWRPNLLHSFNLFVILFPFLLTFPLLIDLYKQATFDYRILAILFGIVMAFLVAGGVLTILASIQFHLGNVQLLKNVTNKLAKIDLRRTPVINSLLATFQHGYLDLEETPFTHRRAMLVFGAAFTVYIVGFLVFDPAYDNFVVDHTPPLTYMILLIALGALVLPSLSYYFDRYRVPVLPVVIICYSIAYALIGIDHYYELIELANPSNAPAQRNLAPQDVVTMWDKHYSADEHPIMVVVAASGGGIKAATWTAHVLGELRRDKELGEKFAEAITLLSTVSGGSVGGMYVNDQYRQPDLPLEKSAQQASESSLNAISWGVAYPDLLHTIVPFNWLIGKTNDRANATERAWRTQFVDTPTTLMMWAQEVEKNWRPLQVFNATIAETGQRLLLSPIEIRSPYTTTLSAQARNFVTLYPGCDLSVVTAARLSATFAYVTPIARPAAVGSCANDTKGHYHLADGGYFDNFGIMTVIEFLSAIGPQQYQKEFHRHKILLVEIRAAPLADVQAVDASSDGFRFASLGPVVTTQQVQSATQVGRNDLELILLKQAWAKEGIEIYSVAFELRKNVVLSWYLSTAEKTDIAQEFYEARNQVALKCLKKFWGISGPTTNCPTLN